MERLMLPSWVSCCEMDEIVIFLDVRRNRYFALRAKVAEALARGDTDGIDQDLVACLHSWGWLDADGDAAPPRSIETALRERALVQTEATIGSARALVLQAVVAICLTWLNLRTRSLRRILQDVEARTRIHVGDADCSPDSVLDTFASIERWLLGPKACLLRSLALQRLLIRHGHASTLVFGVRLRPFAAHCWLQRGDLLLNDSYANVARFQPVRAVQ